MVHYETGIKAAASRQRVRRPGVAPTYQYLVFFMPLCLWSYTPHPENYSEKHQPLFAKPGTQSHGLGI